MSGILDAGTVAEFRRIARRGQVDSATELTQARIETSPGVYAEAPALGRVLKVRVHALGVPAALDAGQLRDAVRIAVSFPLGSVIPVGSLWRLKVRQANGTLAETDVEVVAVDLPNTDPIKTFAHCLLIPRVLIGVYSISVTPSSIAVEAP